MKHLWPRRVFFLISFPLLGENHDTTLPRGKGVFLLFFHQVTHAAIPHAVTFSPSRCAQARRRVARSRRKCRFLLGGGPGRSPPSREYDAGSRRRFSPSCRVLAVQVRRGETAGYNFRGTLDPFSFMNFRAWSLTSQRGFDVDLFELFTRVSRSPLDFPTTHSRSRPESLGRDFGNTVRPRRYKESFAPRHARLSTTLPVWVCRPTAKTARCECSPSTGTSAYHRRVDDPRPTTGTRFAVFVRERRKELF